MKLAGYSKFFVLNLYETNFFLESKIPGIITSPRTLLTDIAPHLIMTHSKYLTLHYI